MQMPDVLQLQKQRVHARKGLALQRASHSGEIALAGSRHLRSTLAARVFFAHTVVTLAKTSSFITPIKCLSIPAPLLPDMVNVLPLPVWP
jgi:hypothetical protein